MFYDFVERTFSIEFEITHAKVTVSLLANNMWYGYQ